MLNNITVLMIQARPSLDSSYLHHRGIGMTDVQNMLNFPSAANNAAMTSSTSLKG